MTLDIERPFRADLLDSPAVSLGKVFLAQEASGKGGGTDGDWPDRDNIDRGNVVATSLMYATENEAFAGWATLPIVAPDGAHRLVALRHNEWSPIACRAVGTPMGDFTTEGLWVFAGVPSDPRLRLSDVRYPRPETSALPPARPQQANVFAVHDNLVYVNSNVNKWGAYIPYADLFLPPSLRGGTGYPWDLTVTAASVEAKAGIRPSDGNAVPDRANAGETLYLRGASLSDTDQIRLVCEDASQRVAVWVGAGVPKTGSADAYYAWLSCDYAFGHAEGLFTFSVQIF